MRDPKLKDIELNKYPDCPDEYIHQGGTEGIVCDRIGFKFVVAEPFLKTILSLYDINIAIISCGTQAEGELGIYIDYESLDEKNKAIADKYIRENHLQLIVDDESLARKFRISIEVDFERNTVVDAEKILYREFSRIGFRRQDVLFGKTTLQNKMDLYNRYFPNMTEKEIMADIIKDGHVIDGNDIWLSKELYNKHKEFEKYEKLREIMGFAECMAKNNEGGKDESY